MKSKNWIIGFFIIFLILFVLANALTIYIDPFFHFHKPHTDKFYYTLDNERSMNDGIMRHFDYDALITGTSMTENFKTSEADEIFNADFVKVPYSGGSFKEINDAEKTALNNNSNVKIIIRALDDYLFVTDKNYMRYDLVGEYPTYLYDDNPFNDVNYTLNTDVLYVRCNNMITSYRNGGEAGITSFDLYSRWMALYNFGSGIVLEHHKKFKISTKHRTLSNKEKEQLMANIKQNITDLADAYPDVDFYYFLPPYSAVYYGDLISSGSLDKYLEQNEISIKEILTHQNIHLFSWNDNFDITCNLNNYKDSIMNP